MRYLHVFVEQAIYTNYKVFQKESKMLEYIREVNVREGKVYLTSKSSNVDIRYHTWCCESLSRIYNEEVQQGWIGKF